jgi:hypothetical protein
MQIKFASTARDRSMVLNDRDVAVLSAAVGRDVRAELEALASRHWPVATFGQLLRALEAELRSRA